MAPVRTSSQAKLSTWQPVLRASQLPRQAWHQSRRMRNSCRPHCSAKTTYHKLCPGSVRSAKGEQNVSAGSPPGSPVVEALTAKMVGMVKGLVERRILGCVNDTGNPRQMW